MIPHQKYRKEYINPYRTGVKIGNYNEELLGEELKYKIQKYTSISKKLHKWIRTITNGQKQAKRDIQVHGNDFTNP